MEDLISVVVPVYNVEKYIRKCLETIINQTYKNIEIIVVDDGSTDNSCKICEEYKKKDKRMQVIHKENGGLSDARNSGLDIINGKYVFFVDSDDYIEFDCIEMLYNSIEKNNTKIAIGGHKVLYENGKTLYKIEKEDCVINSKDALEKLLYDDGVDLSAWAKLYSSELFNNIRYPKGRLFEDAATTYKLIDKVENVSIVSAAVYNYIIRNNSISNCKFSKSKMDLIISTKEMGEYIEKKYPDLKKAAERRIMYAYLSTLSQLAMSNEEFKEEQNEIMKYIKDNRLYALKNKELPKRDRIGLLSTLLGFKFYKFTWYIYRKITGRI